MRLKTLTAEQRQLLREYLSDRMHTMAVYLRNLCAQKYSYRTKALTGQIDYYRSIVSWLKGELATVEQSDAAATQKTAPRGKNGKRYDAAGRNRPRSRATQ